MSQNPDKLNSSEEKLSGLEDDQEENLDNLDQSVRKRIRQSAPGSHRDDAPKCKQSCFMKYSNKSKFCSCCWRQSWCFMAFCASSTVLQLNTVWLLMMCLETVTLFSPFSFYFPNCIHSVYIFLIVHNDHVALSHLYPKYPGVFVLLVETPPQCAPAKLSLLFALSAGPSALLRPLFLLQGRKGSYQQRDVLSAPSQYRWEVWYLILMLLPCKQDGIFSLRHLFLCHSAFNVKVWMQCGSQYFWKICR